MKKLLLYEISLVVVPYLILFFAMAMGWGPMMFIGILSILVLLHLSLLLLQKQYQLFVKQLLFAVFLLVGSILLHSSFMLFLWNIFYILFAWLQRYTQKKLWWIVFIMLLVIIMPLSYYQKPCIGEGYECFYTHPKLHWWPLPWQP